MKTIVSEKHSPGDEPAQGATDTEYLISDGRVWAAQSLVGIAALASWYIASGSLIDPLFISDPVSVVMRLWNWASEGSIFRHIGITLYEAAFGFVLGSILGIGLGIWLGMSQFVARLLSPFILAFYALPKIALAPLFLLWFGLGPEAKVVFTATVVFFLSFYNTFSGVREVDSDLVHTVRLMHANTWQVLGKVIVPSSISRIFAGLQMSVPYALIGAIIAEILAANAGLGYLIQRSAEAFDTTGVLAGLVVTALLAVIINQLVDWVEIQLQTWKIIGQ